MADAEDVRPDLAVEAVQVKSEPIPDGTPEVRVLFCINVFGRKIAQSFGLKISFLKSLFFVRVSNSTTNQICKAF